MSLPAKVSTKSNKQKVGKSTTLPYFNVLSHFKYFLGLKMARATRFLRGLVSTLAGLSKNSAGRFYLSAINETSRADACDINQALATVNLLGRPTVKRDSTNSSVGSQKATPSFDPQLLTQLDIDQLTFALESMVTHQRLAGTHPDGSAVQVLHCQKAAEYRLEAQRLEGQVRQSKHCKTGQR